MNQESKIDTRLASLIDHTLLRADASLEEIDRLCDEARKHQFAAVCVNSCHVRHAARRLAGTGVKVCSTIGFPLGAASTGAKVAEATEALDNGAAEIDMVMNVGLLKSGRESDVESDIRRVIDAAHQKGAICKVILETAILSPQEKLLACEIAVRAGADFVKTSTGFGHGGATVEDVALMRRAVGPTVGVKASGGIRTRAAALAMVAAGANRIGASASIALISIP